MGHSPLIDTGKFPGGVEMCSGLQERQENVVRTGTGSRNLPAAEIEAAAKGVVVEHGNASCSHSTQPLCVLHKLSDQLGR